MRAAPPAAEAPVERGVVHDKARATGDGAMARTYGSSAEGHVRMYHVHLYAARAAFEPAAAAHSHAPAAANAAGVGAAAAGVHVAAIVAVCLRVRSASREISIVWAYVDRILVCLFAPFHCFVVVNFAVSRFVWCALRAAALRGWNGLSVS